MSNILDLNQLAREIVANNQYLTLATTDKTGIAWVSPVVYAYDSKNIFYFISLPTSKHVKNLKGNSKVSFAIFDSHQVWGEGVGLQIEGVVKEVTLTQLPKMIAIYLSRKWPYINNKYEAYLKGFQQLLKNRTYKAYAISPTRVWMNDPRKEVDVRVEVKLN
jgi:uncharacterized protein YhbP (UPF0306 family)